MRKGQGAFEYILLMGGILMIALVAFFMLRGTNQVSVNQAEQAKCFAKLATVGVCYFDNGTWKPDTTTLRNAIDYGLDPKCTMTNGGLNGTAWDDPASEDKFKCGSRPPQE
ncbi:MAG: class III signal peptide-containing protein [Candidatus Micrarchaeota archaeon]